MKTAFGAAFRRAAQPDKRESLNARSGPRPYGRGPPAPDPPQHAAVAVHLDLVEAVLLHLPPHQLRHALLPAGGAGDADGLLAEGISSSSRLSCSLHFPQRTALLKILLW